MSSCSGENKLHSILVADLSFDKSEMVAEGNYLSAASSPDDIFSILEALESSEFDPLASVVVEQNGTNNINDHEEGDPVNSNYMEEPKAAQYMDETLAAAATAGGGEGNGNDSSRKTKRQKLMSCGMVTEEEDVEGQQKVSHITVERNRRKQMNDNLIVLRSLMPSFYVKRGDQASIVGGVVDYINELQQVLQSLEAKKQRKVYSEVLSPRVAVSSPRLSSSAPISPRKTPLSPRLIANSSSSSVPISPTTPTPTSSYNNNKRHRLYQLSPAIILPAAAAVSSSLLEPCRPSSSSLIDRNELVANAKSAIADVEVKLSGPHVVLKTISPVIPGQAVKIISALEEYLSLEIIDFSLNTIDHQTMLNSFTIKIGIECKLSADELAQQIQQTFS